MLKSIFYDLSCLFVPNLKINKNHTLPPAPPPSPRTAVWAESLVSPCEDFFFHDFYLAVRACMSPSKKIVFQNHQSCCLGYLQMETSPFWPSICKGGRGRGGQNPDIWSQAMNIWKNGRFGDISCYNRYNLSDLSLSWHGRGKYHLGLHI